VDQIVSDVLIKLTGLWERTRRGNPGNTYLVGRLGAAKILVFKNTRKENPDDPDFNIFLTEPSPPQQDKPPRIVADPRIVTDPVTITKDSSDRRVNELAAALDSRGPDEELPF
jgi:hypothetical protein